MPTLVGRKSGAHWTALNRTNKKREPPARPWIPRDVARHAIGFMFAARAGGADWSLVRLRSTFKRHQAVPDTIILNSKDIRSMISCDFWISWRVDASLQMGQ